MAAPCRGSHSPCLQLTILLAVCCQLWEDEPSTRGTVGLGRSAEDIGGALTTRDCADGSLFALFVGFFGLGDEWER